MKNNFDMSLLDNPIEVVYFAYPTCDGNCSHCWSHDISLGTVVPLKVHLENIRKLKKIKISDFKISGGEPFFNKDIGTIIKTAKKELKKSNIIIFTSGRPFISKKSGIDGINETYKNLTNIIDNFNNISIHMSIDEYHALVLKNKDKSDLTQEELINIHVKNFIGACKLIKRNYKKFDYKLKLHVNIGRIEYHRKYYYPWMSDYFWNKHVIATEGLIKSGNAKNIKNSFKIKPSDMWSLFVLPGTNFVLNSDKYISKFYNKQIDKYEYLIKDNNESIIIAGWWNIIDRNSCYIKISDI